MIEGLGDAGGCSVGEVLQFAEINNLIITPIAEFNKTILVVALIGAFIGIVAWELFKCMYDYGKRHSSSKDN